MESPANYWLEKPREAKATKRADRPNYGLGRADCKLRRETTGSEEPSASYGRRWSGGPKWHKYAPQPRRPARGASAMLVWTSSDRQRALGNQEMPDADLQKHKLGGAVHTQK